MLTARQAKFVELYIDTGNATEAARQAGYASGSANVTACRLLNNPEVASAVSTKRREIENQHHVDRTRVINGLLEGVAIAEQKGDASNVIAGWRELGKMLGYYEPERKKVDVSLDARRVISRFERMSDAELVACVENAPTDVV